MDFYGHISIHCSHYSSYLSSYTSMPDLISTSGEKKEGIGAGTMHKRTFSSSSLETLAISTIWLFKRCLLSAECWGGVNVSVRERDACVLLLVWYKRCVCIQSVL